MQDDRNAPRPTEAIKPTVPYGATQDVWIPPYAEGQSVTSEPRRKKRVFMWSFLAIQLLFVIWIVSGAVATGSTATDTGGVLTQEEAITARDAGAAIGVLLIVGLWAVVDLILGITWAVVKLARR